jgi:outer membrane lipopolysaccharide assembly protein LptE/RlpB
MMLAAIFGLFAVASGHVPVYHEPKKKAQDFTDEELEAVRSCATKQERKAMVNELRRKYAKKV